MREIIILGSTGSIGENSLIVIKNNPERFKLKAIAANKNWRRLFEQAREYNIKHIALYDHKAFLEAKSNNKDQLVIHKGMDGILELLDLPHHTLINSVVGAVGLRPSFYALGRSERLALANKESIVMGGEKFIREAENSSTELVPIDSEHSAILQAMKNERRNVKEITLTASGGPFYFSKNLDFSTITPEEALKHPTWNMGRKISIDSATLFNKALEIIEAAYLYHLNEQQIKVVIHPQSYIHSFVEFIDGSQLAQMSFPDMKIPIQYALTYPDRYPAKHSNPSLWEIGKFDFYKPDHKRFPSLSLAYECLKHKRNASLVLNAANEVAVYAFLNKKISFNKIFHIVEKSLKDFIHENRTRLDDLYSLDEEVRNYANNLCNHP